MNNQRLHPDEFDKKRIEGLKGDGFVVTLAELESNRTMDQIISGQRAKYGIEDKNDDKF